MSNNVLLLFLSCYLIYSCDITEEQSEEISNLNIAVTDTANIPMSGVDVKVVNTKVYNLKTDSLGNCRQSNLKAISTNILANKENYCSVLHRMVLKKGDNQIKFQLMPITEFIDDFESQFLRAEWNSFGDANWFITSTEAQSGFRSIRSGNIDDYESSGVELEFAIESDNMQISFWYKVSSESCCDHLNFYHNNNYAESWGGNIDWTYYSKDLDQGTHNFRWTYSKDGSVSTGDDCAWLDNVSITKK